MTEHESVNSRSCSAGQDRTGQDRTREEGGKIVIIKFRGESVTMNIVLCKTAKDTTLHQNLKVNMETRQYKYITLFLYVIIKYTHAFKVQI